MSTTELLDAVLTANGVDVESLPDRLETTYLRAIYEANGGNPDELPDNLTTTLLGAIASVASGGGNTGGGGGNTGGGGSDLDALIDGSITELTSNVTSIIGYAAYKRNALQSVEFPEATSIGEYAFGDCTQLTSVKLPNVTNISYRVFCNCTRLTSVTFPNAKILHDNAFYMCTQLTSADFLNATTIQQGVFYYCSSLRSLILRKNDAICTLQIGTSLAYTPIASGTGYIYVPRALLSDDDAKKDYRRATNWSSYANRFRALEDYTVDGTITGELDESKI